ncbi:hypothetical protein, partial [Plasticicumulans sp.]|uniref:hypothetical protein n=1 Tax=Plasticicumulans sp. TaxID=2307179 RepID=UPI002CF28F46
MFQVSARVLELLPTAFRRPVLLPEVPIPEFRIAAPGCRTPAPTLQTSMPTHFGAALTQKVSASTVE